MCSNTKGGHLTPNNAERELAAAVKRAGIPRVTAHEFRHTFISLLENEWEAPPSIVAALAGKTDDRVTSGYSLSHRTQLEKWMKSFWSEVYKVREVGHLKEA